MTSSETKRHAWARMMMVPVTTYRGEDNNDMIVEKPGPEQLMEAWFASEPSMMCMICHEPVSEGWDSECGGAPIDDFLSRVLGDTSIIEGDEEDGPFH